MTTRKLPRPLLGLLAAPLLLAACQDPEVILPGARLDARAVTSPDGPQVEQNFAVQAGPVALPPARANAEWTHRGGNAQHLPGHVALGAGNRLLWAADIGPGDGRQHRIAADPVVGGGRVFTLDSRAGVVATGLNGGTLWRTDITPAGETSASVSGGGLAFANGQVFASSGFGELVALDAATGRVQWRQRVNAPIGGAPTVSDGVVYVTGRNAIGWAVTASDGKLLWQADGTPQPTGHMAASAPAVDGDLVVFPFASGQLLAVDRATGVQRWSAQVAGTRVGRAISYIRDMTGEPVIAGNTVYGGTSSGRINAFDREGGFQLWSAREGAMSAVVPVGNSVFAVNDANQLVRIDASTGGVVWQRDLPWFRTDNPRRQDAIWAHYGPVLAGGRLIVASSDGYLRMFDPSSGQLIGQAEIPGGAATAPVVAGQTLYLVNRNGQLLAYR
ncbi:MAG: PQQ-binding-like beta-propeller repeat protein [Paracoccus sp. (in: a-proteobacteria)]|nr:PQQ-binding-like beta-propeller repeat protein [Paracoccus sp. (in: a-proteobacteria)]